MSHDNGDVVVAGAGLIGLAIAFELAERGAAVRVYDRAEPARAASWAGAGMLAPYTERIADETMLALCLASLGEYPRFVERIAGRSGIDSHLKLDGVFYAAFGERELDALRAQAKALHERGVAADLLDRAQALSSEPWLAASLSGGLVKQNEGHVDNRRLGRALSAACRSPRRSHRAQRAAGNRMRRTPRARRGRRSRICCRRLGGKRLRCVGGATARRTTRLHTSGRAGQRADAGAGRTRGIRAPRNLGSRSVSRAARRRPAADRRDGRAGGFDERVTAQGMHELLHAALRAAPSLGGFAVTEKWAGLRPGTPGRTSGARRDAARGLLFSDGPLSQRNPAGAGNGAADRRCRRNGQRFGVVALLARSLRHGRFAP